MKVLCVERDIFQLGHMKREEKRIVPDARVTACRSPSKAKEIVETEGCDVLLTGIDMGGGKTEGIRLARTIKEINPRVNIIFVTVCGEWEHAAAIFQLRPSGYVRKPYESQRLAEEFANLRYATG